MKFKPQVTVVSPGGAYLHKTHAAQAERYVRAGQCERVSSGTIRICIGQSLGSIRYEHQVSGPPIVPRHRRRPVHDVTKPKSPGKPHLYRADTGQTGSYRVIHLESYFALLTQSQGSN